MYKLVYLISTISSHCQKLHIQTFQLRFLVYLAAAYYWSQKCFSKKEILLSRKMFSLHCLIPLPGEYSLLLLLCGVFSP